jgi:uncharacterized protein involved in exopolysaccharide biosynthesis
MKRALRTAAWLYPKRWRNRYGDEFEALIEDARGDWRSLQDVMKGAVKMQFSCWGFGKIAAITVLAGAAIAAVIAYRIPNEYESRATLRISAFHRVSYFHQPEFLPETDPVTNQHLGELTIRRIIASVESFENLGQIINDFDLYGVRWSAPPVDVMERMKHAIVVAPSGDREPSFTVRFEYPDRLKAQRVMQELLSRVIESNLHLAIKDPGSRVEILAPPTLPRFPVSPNRLAITGEGSLAGLCGGILLSLVMRMRRNSSAVCPTCGRAAGEPVS